MENFLKKDLIYY